MNVIFENSWFAQSWSKYCEDAFQKKASFAKMARIRYLDESDLQPEDRELLGRGLNLYRALAHSPGAARSFQNFARFLRYESALDPRLRELAILQIGYLAKVPYSFYGHIGFVSGDFGVSPEDVKGVIAETEGRESDLDSIARVVLQAAREITETFMISDKTFNALRPSFSEGELTDLISTMAFYNAALRYIKTMQIDIEQHRLESYEKLKVTFPLPSN